MEKIMKDSLLLLFLYHTVFGRMILKGLVQPKVSAIAGRYLSSEASRWLVPYYIRKHDIDMSDIVIPAEGFASFNAFFTRSRAKWRCDWAKDHLISPCDGYLKYVKIKKNKVFAVKHTEFSLEDLLQDKRLADRFLDGVALIFRLTPANYHRYCYAADGRSLSISKIAGRLHCVRPVALRKFPVFAQNCREYQVIETDSFGTVVQMEIGALLVGKISNHKKAARAERVYAGEEKGYFEFGGSTIIILLPKDAACFPGKLYRRKNEDGEITVHMGEIVAKKKYSAPAEDFTGMSV